MKLADLGTPKSQLLAYGAGSSDLDPSKVFKRGGKLLRTDGIQSRVGMAPLAAENPTLFLNARVSSRDSAGPPAL